MIHHSGAGVFSIRSGKWKFKSESKGGGYHSGGSQTGSPGQLFKLEVDPYETNDLWDENPGIVHELESLLGLYIRQDYSRPGLAAKE